MSPGWLIARPIAHRGLHDRARGIVENSPQATRAAIARGFAVECDVQLSADGEAMVFHDYTLERLTEAHGRVDAISAEKLSSIALKGSGDCIPTLSALLTEIGGRVPLVCEIKSRFDGDTRLAERAASIAASHDGPIALKSFDPNVLAHLRANTARLRIEKIPLGLVAQARYDDPADEWACLSAGEKRALANVLHWRETRPDFLSWGVKDQPHATPFLCRAALGLPVMTWTIRTPEQASVAKKWADQMIFEGDIAS